MKTLLLLLALIVPASARIGETAAECNKRYGEPRSVSKEEKIITYQKAGLIIVIQFWEEKAAMIMYGKADADILGNPEEMSEAEIDKLLDANKGGSEWGGNSKIFGGRWSLNDGTREAELTVENRLIILTSKYLKFQNAQKEAKEKKALDGF